MAAGILAGHLIECGAQVSGGYFADPGLKDVSGLANVGFPLVEVEEDGSSFVITKPDGTGGVVNKRTVKEQLLLATTSKGLIEMILTFNYTLGQEKT